MDHTTAVCVPSTKSWAALNPSAQYVISTLQALGYLHFGVHRHLPTSDVDRHCPEESQAQDKPDFRGDGLVPRFYSRHPQHGAALLRLDRQ